MKYLVKINDKEYEVEVEKGKANIVKTVQVSSEQVEYKESSANLESKPTPAAMAESPATPLNGGIVVKAPMPGTVLDIKASVGQKVKEGDLLLLLEAMKMENEILASESGTVKQVLVTKGASVATDDILITIE